MLEKLSPAAVSQLMRSRKSVFPSVYTAEPVDRRIIEEMLENANWAPNHKKTEPWRFKVFRGPALQQLAKELATIYKNTVDVEQFSEKKFTKLSKNPLKADTIIAIVMHRDEEERLPEWEEVAAVACAVQNMWLTCTAYGLGCYWSSPGIIKHLGEFLKLKENEKCLGLFYVANHENIPVNRERQPIADKVEWREEN